MKRKQDTPRCH